MKIYQAHYDVTVETDNSRAGQLVDEVASLINEYVEYEEASGDYEISFTVGSSLSASAKQDSAEIDVTFTGDETSGEVMEVLAPYIVAMYDQQDSDFNDDETGYLIDIGVSLSADPAYVARIPTREDPEIRSQAENLLTEFNRRTGSLDQFVRDIVNQAKTLEDLETSIARQTTVLESLRARIQIAESEEVSKVVGQFNVLSTQLEDLVAFVESHSKVRDALEVKSQEAGTDSAPLAVLGKVFRLINLVNGARIKRLHELIVREIESKGVSSETDMMTRLLKWMVSIINLNRVGNRKLQFSNPLDSPLDRRSMIIVPENASAQGKVSEVLLLGIPGLRLKSLVSVADSGRGS